MNGTTGLVLFLAAREMKQTLEHIHHTTDSDQCYTHKARIESEEACILGKRSLGPDAT